MIKIKTGCWKDVKPHFWASCSGIVWGWIWITQIPAPQRVRMRKLAWEAGQCDFGSSKLLFHSEWIRFKSILLRMLKKLRKQSCNANSLRIFFVTAHSYTSYTDFNQRIWIACGQSVGTWPCPTSSMLGGNHRISAHVTPTHTHK